MRSRKPKIKAIPTTYNSINYRSRLEARWASFLDSVDWPFEYEPDLQAGMVIPDFLLTDFAHAVILECKPEITPADLAAARRILIAKMPGWLRSDVTREIAELDLDPELPVELTDQALDDLVRVDCGENPRGRSRRILVVGPNLHPGQSRLTLDGDYGFCLCTHSTGANHVGLALELGQPCLRCGGDATTWVPQDLLLEAWRSSGNAAQWKPVSPAE